MYNCKNCSYWSKYTTVGRPEDLGQCRIKPPTVIYNKDFMNTCAWPDTSALQWCGQFKEKVRG